MPDPDNRELLKVARAWSAVNYPGCPLEYITVHLRYLAVPIQLAEGPSDRPAAAPVEERGGALDDCTADILKTLEAAGPLTKTLLFREMVARLSRGECGEYSDSTICRRLALLMEDETIVNPKGAKPPGYRLNR